MPLARSSVRFLYVVGVILVAVVPVYLKILVLEGLKVPEIDRGVPLPDNVTVPEVGERTPEVLTVKTLETV